MLAKPLINELRGWLFKRRNVRAPFGTRLRAWRVARGFNLDQAVDELRTFYPGRPSLHLSAWSFDSFERGATPLPQEKLILEKIMELDENVVLPPDRPGDRKSG